MASQSKIIVSHSLSCQCVLTLCIAFYSCLTLPCFLFKLSIFGPLLTPTSDSSSCWNISSLRADATSCVHSCILTAIAWWEQGVEGSWMAPQSIPTQACGRSLNSVIPLEFAKLPLLGRSLSLGCVARPPFSACSEQLLVVLRLPHCLAQPLQFSHPPQAPLLR